MAVLEKGLKEADVEVEIAPRRLTVRRKVDMALLFDKVLYEEVLPDKKRTRFMASKVIPLVPFCTGAVSHRGNLCCSLFCYFDAADIQRMNVYKSPGSWPSISLLTKLVSGGFGPWLSNARGCTHGDAGGLAGDLLRRHRPVASMTRYRI